jgi:twitching motility protein PilT
VREAIIDETKTRQIPSIIAGGLLHYGMQTFDQSLLMLYKKGVITYEEALMTASNPDDFALRVKGIQSTSDMSMEADEKRTSGIKENIGGAKKATESEFKIDRFGDK